MNKKRSSKSPRELTKLLADIYLQKEPVKIQKNVVDIIQYLRSLPIEKSVTDIMIHTRESQSRTSQSLSLLRQINLVNAEVDGKHVYYKINKRIDTKYTEIFKSLQLLLNN